MIAMILAAGLGTRLKPWTDKHPKALAELYGKSLLQRNIEYLQQFNIADVVVNVHHFADQIVDAVERNNGWGSNVIISDETDEVLETGGGLLKAAAYLKGDKPFVLMNVDILTDLDLHKMLNYHQEYLPLATLAVSDRKTSRYFLFDDNHNLCGWRKIVSVDPLVKEEKGNNERLNSGILQKAFSGIHIIDPRIFSYIKQEGKFSMVEVYLDLMQTHTIKGFDHSGSKFIDVGKPESIEKAEGLFS